MSLRAVRLPVSDPQWSGFVSEHPDSTTFHLPVWASIIADCYHFNAFALAVRDDAGEIVAGAPVIEVRAPLGGLRWVSLPFSDECPLLVRGEARLEDVVDALRESALSSDVRALEVRGDLPLAADVHAVQVGYHHLLRLPADPSGFHPNKGHRYNRSKARRAGVRVVRGTAPADVMTYYRLHTLTRRRLGVPVQPRRFFDLIADRLITQGHGFVATAMLDGRAVASGVYLSHKGTLTAKYGASDPAYRDTGASSLYDWEVMVAACREGLYHTLDFGRTDSDAEGLRAYKTGWGAEETPLIYTQVLSHGLGDSRPHVGALPRRVIQGSPTWVCRALGEALYRWTA
jgi:CelD/BcsL family acetyltransferase involved in cellulose biosynthesis